MGSYVGRHETAIAAESADVETGTRQGELTNDVGGIVGEQSGSEVK